MEIYNSLIDVNCEEHELVLALGNFDGIHLGHQRLLESMVEDCCREGKKPSVLLFHPHPQVILNPRNDLQMLQTTDRKVEMMDTLGIQSAFIIPFDDSMVELTDEEFVKSVIVDCLKVAGVFIGFNYSFGCQAMGTPTKMSEYGNKYGFSVTIIPPVIVNGSPVSSTAVRRALACGDIALAEQLLGYLPGEGLNENVIMRKKMAAN